MNTINELLEKNRVWSEQMAKEQPEFFGKLAGQQIPKFLWIGCADSRVPATQICNLDPGEMFVHRNVANLVIHTDLNCLSVLQYAVDVLKVSHVIVCGHYGCGGVAQALKTESLGLIDNWIENIKDVYRTNKKELDQLADGSEKKVNLLCELNVKQQVANLCHTTVVQDAWKRKQKLAVHGWIYGLKNGKLKELGLHFESPEEVSKHFGF